MNGVTFVKLENHHCRWIIGQGGDYDLAIYCGKNRLSGSSYCHDHTMVSRGIKMGGAKEHRPGVPAGEKKPAGMKF